MRPKTVWSLTRQAAGVWRVLVASAPPETDARRERIRALYDGFRPAFAQVVVVGPGHLVQALAQDERVVLIDVRSAAERRVASLSRSLESCRSVRRFARNSLCTHDAQLTSRGPSTWRKLTKNLS